MTATRWRRRHRGSQAPAGPAATFEFAHLLDPVRPVTFTGGDGPEITAVDEPREPQVDPHQPVAGPMTIGEVDALLGLPAAKLVEPVIEEISAPITEEIPVIPASDPFFDFFGTAQNEVVPDPEPEPEPELVSAAPATVSRFATAGLDDDRLPLARRRRGKRAK